MTHCVELKYRLLHPVIGFSQSLKRVVTIPAGTTVNLFTTTPEIGVCRVSSDGREIVAMLKDIEENSVALLGTVARA